LPASNWQCSSFKTSGGKSVADIRIYINDNTEVTKLTGWKPEISVKDIIEDTCEWLVANEQQLSYVLR
jgi:CDP-paratose 2-epimerase